MNAKTQQRSVAQTGDLFRDEEVLHREQMLDEALQATFPASDPLAFTEPGAYRVVATEHRRAAA